MLDELVPYQDLGGNWFVRRGSLEHRARRLVRQLALLGYEVTVEAQHTAEDEAA